MTTNQSDLTAFDGETPEDACVRYEICGNVVPQNGRMCADCLDAVRAADREQQEETLVLVDYNVTLYSLKHMFSPDKSVLNQYL
jgi:hypothetical protein